MTYQVRAPKPTDVSYSVSFHLAIYDKVDHLWQQLLAGLVSNREYQHLTFKLYPELKKEVFAK